MRAGVTPEQADRLNKIETAGQHLLDIINAVLDLSKIDAGKFSLDQKPIDFNLILDNVRSIIGEKAHAKGLQVSIDCQLSGPGLLGDPTRIQQALLNYASNAVKFTHHGIILIGARTESETAKTQTIRFEVQDTGIGVSPDAIPRLFSAFEQADNSITRKYGGTGLGLAITRKIAEIMGGEAGADSYPGRGSTFTLRFPPARTS